jgi:hypothetical protein
MLDLARRYFALSALDVVGVGLRTAKLAAYSFAKAKMTTKNRVAGIKPY